MENPELVIVSNICNYFWRYRGIKGDAMPTESALVNNLNADGYVQLNGVYENGKKISIFVIALQNMYTDSKDHILKFNKRIMPLAVDEAIIIIADTIYEHKKNIVEEIKLMSTEASVLVYPYHIFVIAVPFHSAVPKHILLTPEEFYKQVEGERIKTSDILVISHKDPPIIWLGGKPGQVVLIERFSQTAGKSVVYRYIV